MADSTKNLPPLRNPFILDVMKSQSWSKWFAWVGISLNNLIGLRVFSASATLDFGSIASLASEDLTITVTKAAVNDSVSLGLPTPTAGIVFQAFVSAVDTVTIRATNITGGAVDPASAIYKVIVFKV